jgi:hypothetical protein
MKVEDYVSAKSDPREEEEENGYQDCGSAAVGRLLFK